MGIIISYKTISDYFLSDQKKNKNDNFYQGVLKSPEINQSGNEPILNFDIKNINKNYPKITGLLIHDLPKTNQIGISIGTSVLIENVKKIQKEGLNVFYINKNGCNNQELILGIKDNRLYVSTTFRYIDNEETIGDIEFNHWKLYKPNLFDFYNDDSRLEVIDKHNDIVFSIQYIIIDKTPNIVIGGYFISPSSVLIIGNKKNIPKDTTFNGCILKSDTNWKPKAINKIRQNITSIFSYSEKIK